jgi:hypothetical protein
MTKQAKAFPILSVAVLLGCATPYQPAGFRGGYSDLTLDNNTVRLFSWKWSHIKRHCGSLSVVQMCRNSSAEGF